MSIKSEAYPDGGIQEDPKTAAMRAALICCIKALTQLSKSDTIPHRANVEAAIKMGRRALDLLALQIAHIEEHREAFREHQGFEPPYGDTGDVTGYFKDHNQDGECYYNLCADLEIEPRV